MLNFRRGSSVNSEEFASMIQVHRTGHGSLWSIHFPWILVYADKRNAERKSRPVLSNFVLLCAYSIHMICVLFSRNGGERRVRNNIRILSYWAYTAVPGVETCSNGGCYAPDTGVPRSGGNCIDDVGSGWVIQGDSSGSSTATAISHLFASLCRSF